MSRLVDAMKRLLVLRDCRRDLLKELINKILLMEAQFYSDCLCWLSIECKLNRTSFREED